MIAVILAALALNPAVTQQTVSTTICQPGYAAAYRKHHPVRVPTKPGMIRDHIVSLELGGSSAKGNIQYQTRAEAARKDRLEDQLHQAVCAGKVSLKDAQLRMEAWR